MKGFKLSVTSILFFLLAGCVQAPLSAPDPFADKPYGLRLGLIQAFDPKPLQVESFVPDGNPAFNGTRVTSSGRAFPFVYTVISAKVREGADPLTDLYAQVKENPRVSFVDRSSNGDLGDHIHFTERFEQQGKPHHIASNYMFIRGDRFFHVAAENYGPVTLGRLDWKDEDIDVNAEREVLVLIRSLQYPKEEHGRQ
jgi:hypothetical protein